MSDEHLNAQETEEVEQSILLTPHATRFPLYLLLGLFTLELVIYLLDYGLNFSQRGKWDNAIRGIFKTTTEDGLASWASQTQTMLVALTLWFLVVVQRAKNAPKWTTIGWAILALFFTYMSIDDGAKIHERVGSAIGRIEDSSGVEIMQYFPSYAWQAFVLPFFAVMGVYMLGFLWFQMRDRVSRILLICSICMFVTALAIDFFEGLAQWHEWNIFDRLAVQLDIDDFCQEHYGENGFETILHFSKSAEECFLEMGANSILWFLFIRHLIREMGTLQIKFRRS